MGKKPKRATSFIFDILDPKDLSGIQIYRNINQAIKTITKYMRRIAGVLKLDRVPTTNFAQHSFSTVLKRAGTQKTVFHTTKRNTHIFPREKGGEHSRSYFLRRLKVTFYFPSTLA